MISPENPVCTPLPKSVHCHLECYSNSPLLSYLYAGFSLLNFNREISLSQSIAPRNAGNGSAPNRSHPRKDAFLRVKIDGQVAVHFDVHDGQNIDEPIAEAVDVYFKRSYSVQAISNRFRRRVVPLGLAYQLYPGGVDWLEMARIVGCELRWRRKAASVIRCFGPMRLRSYRPLFHSTIAVPNPTATPRILFVTRAWSTDKNRGLGFDRVNERMRLNQMRADCIRILKREFGGRFVGGFTYSREAGDKFPDLIVPTAELARRTHYFELLRSVPICVSTQGIQCSTPWKLAEYVLHSRSIVSETLCSDVPGGFESGSNYLSFSAADQCVESCTKLAQDASLREEMMYNNQRYSKSHLSAPMVVRNAINQALHMVQIDERSAVS